jgi:hypothetical protein
LVREEEERCISSLRQSEELESLCWDPNCWWMDAGNARDSVCGGASDRAQDGTRPSKACSHPSRYCIFCIAQIGASLPSWALLAFSSLSLLCLVWFTSIPFLWMKKLWRCCCRGWVRLDCCHITRGSCSVSWCLEVRCVLIPFLWDCAVLRLWASSPSSSSSSPLLLSSVPHGD